MINLDLFENCPAACEDEDLLKMISCIREAKEIIGNLPHETQGIKCHGCTNCKWFYTYFPDTRKEEV